MPRPRVATSVLLSLLTLVVVVDAQTTSPSTTVEYFPLSAVQLVEGPMLNAQEKTRAYVLAHDVDRLLVPFLSEAGLPTSAQKYPNWESTGLDGHTAGHYLTALAQFAALGDVEMSRRLNYMVSQLRKCQEAHGNGYVGPVPGSKAFWEEIAAGKLKVEPFGINGKWVPWYNLHKLYAGLRDAWQIAGSTEARDVLVRLTDWCDATLANLTDAQMQEMLRAEHGGMNEVIADVYAYTRNPRHLSLAQRFSHRAVLEPLMRHEDRLDGMHANTQIPKVIGFARIAEFTRETAWRDAAEFFWETVVKDRTVAFGGNSVREHFHARGDFSAMLESREGPETCNTYNMLRLSELLFRTNQRAEYADYYERALFNHILSSVHPEHGGFVYFTPIRPQHYRVYSRAETCFWCCVGSGMENHGKYGRFIYAHHEGGLLVNLFVPSRLSWAERDLTLTQETRFPDEGRSRLKLQLKQPSRFTLAIRRPEWAKGGGFRIKVNGEDSTGVATRGGYVSIVREWRDGDVVEVELPLQTSLEPLPDNSGYVALMHGPIVLAAKTDQAELDGLIADDSRMGHIAPGAYRPLSEAPMLVGDAAGLATAIRRNPTPGLSFNVREVVQPEKYKELELVPFYRVHDARYMVYWKAATPSEYQQIVATIKADEEARLALDARTVDSVTPGEQQPEVEHGYTGEESKTGHTLGKSWRDAGKSFGYRLRADQTGPLELRVTYPDWRTGGRFDVLVNGRVLATEHLDGRRPDHFKNVVYTLPDDLVRAGDGKIEVRFVAKEGSRAGPVFDVRVLKPAAQK